MLVRGSISDRDRDEDDPPIFLDSAVRLGSLRNSGQVGLEVRLSSRLEGDMLGAAAAAFRRHPGAAPVFVSWHNDSHEGPDGSRSNGDQSTRMRSKQFMVDLSEELIAELRRLFGADRIRLVKA